MPDRYTTATTRMYINRPLPSRLPLPPSHSFYKHSLTLELHLSPAPLSLSPTPATREKSKQTSFYSRNAIFEASLTVIECINREGGGGGEGGEGGGEGGVGEEGGGEG